jgi:hypothetical protein
MKLRIVAAVELSNRDARDLQREIERVSHNMVIVPLKNGLVRVMDNHYDVVSKADVDPVNLYDWLTNQPNDLSLQEFQAEWVKFLGTLK